MAREAPLPAEAELMCAAPGCSAFGPYVFRHVVLGGRESVKRACAAHRARGQAWLDAKLATPPDKETAAATAPAQKSLF